MKTRLVSLSSFCAFFAFAPFVSHSHSQASCVQRCKVAPRIKMAKSTCANPRGMKVRVRSFFTVTNSDDGVADNVVEVYGNVAFNSQRVWNVTRDNARSIDNKPNPNYPDVMTTGPQNNEIQTSSRTFDVIFDSSTTWNLIVTGYMHDRDKGVLNKDDGMWNPFKMPQVVNIKRMADKLKRRGQEQYFTLAGDRDSENANLTLVVSKVGDIY